MRRFWKPALGALVLVVSGWSAWWFIGAQGQQAGIEAWLDNQRQRGWHAEASNVDVTGFPSDFSLQLTNIALADPKTGWAWQAPTLDAESTSYQPTRVVITWPEKQALSTPYETIDIQTQAMTTVLDLRPGPSMELREASGAISDLVLTGRAGWTASASGVETSLAERPDDLAPPNSYDLKVVAADVRLPKDLVEKIDPTGWLDASVDRLTIKGHAALDAPLDRNALENGRLALRAATIREAGFEWGAMRLVLKGSFVVDDNGFPDGKIEIEAREWRQMVRLAVASGTLDRSTAKTVTKAIELLTAFTGSGKNLTAPLNLSDGKLRIGPFAITDAPRLAPPR